MEPEEEEVVVYPCHPIEGGDLGFSDWFTVSKNDWVIKDRIDTFGFIYIHILTRRPLAIYRTVDMEGNLNGYTINTFPNHGIVEHSVTLAGANEIDALLIEISLHYVADGIWSNCIIDDDKEEENNDKFHDIIVVDDYDDNDYHSYYTYFLQCLKMQPLTGETTK